MKPYSFNTYEQGPTSCIASPDVLKNIRHGLKSGNFLSFSDVRLARNMGWLSIPTLESPGFNDGVIYPSDDAVDAPALAARRGPIARVSLNEPKGELRALVLLVDFPDNTGTQSPSHYENLLFDQANPNSMSSFYREMSYGSLNVTGEVVGWLRAPNPYTYYTAGKQGTGKRFPNNTPGLLQDILDIFTRTRSLSDFDVNGDGFVDGLFLVHAGAGAEAEPDEVKRDDMIWSHKWTLLEPYIQNGTKAYAYFTAPEDGKLGVFSHEFGHFLGLPDLYDTSYRGEGVGNWCLMGGGSWLGKGDQPARLSAWCLEQLGWIKPKVISASEVFQIDTLAKRKQDCLKIWAYGKKGPEYFLLENRQQDGRDALLPASGLALWHVDMAQADNTNPLAAKVALIQADGEQDLQFGVNRGDDNDLFPGGMEISKVSDRLTTQPNTRLNDGSKSGIALSKIAEKDGMVNVSVTI